MFAHLCERRTKVDTVDRGHPRDGVISTGRLREPRKQADREVQVGDVHGRVGSLAEEVRWKGASRDKCGGGDSALKVHPLSTASAMRVRRVRKVKIDTHILGGRGGEEKERKRGGGSREIETATTSRNGKQHAIAGSAHARSLSLYLSLSASTSFLLPVGCEVDGALTEDNCCRANIAGRHCPRTIGTAWERVQRSERERESHEPSGDSGGGGLERPGQDPYERRLPHPRLPQRPAHVPCSFGDAAHHRLHRLPTRVRAAGVQKPVNRDNTDRGGGGNVIGPNSPRKDPQPH